nr:peptidoglycan synthetase [Chitinophagales bacterium]
AQITLISGIAWDHFNVFPTFENYTNQFKILMESLSPQQLLILNEEDQNINSLLNNSKVKAEIKKYSTPDYFLENNAFHLQFENKVYIFEIFGKHNMQNMEAARLVCNALNIENDVFYSAMESFKGAAKRLEILYKNDSGIVFRDFAHAPSKVQATVDAVKEQYPERKLIACLELHTFSSLNKTFIAHYKNTMNKADVRIVYFNPHTVQLKKLPELLPEEVKHFFNDDSLHVINNSAQLSELLKMLKSVNTNFLLMSSGNFDNLEFTILT